MTDDEYYDPGMRMIPIQCCTISREGGVANHRSADSTGRDIGPGMVSIPGGRFLMGTNDKGGFPGDGEGPVREVTMAAFRISPTAVTNAEYSAFIAETDYVTEAERFGWSYVFVHLATENGSPTQAPPGVPWWRQVYGADWSHPFGPGTDVVGLEDHPVVHVSWHDAVAYCNWAGGRLPTEAEWEYAARGGLVQKRYAWGDEFAPVGTTMCNIFEGDFPNARPGQHVGTLRVDSYPPNGYGLFNVAGNVWEWCLDWFGVPRDEDGAVINPTGTQGGRTKVMKGGSYLCHDSYCNRYRVAARTSNTPDSSAGNIGFRIAAD